MPSWSNDGKWIYFASNRSGELQIWKVPRSGESPSDPAVQVTKEGGFRPIQSRDGKYLYFAKGRGRRGLWRLELNDNVTTHEEPVLPSLENWGWWTIADNGIYFFEKHDTATELKFSDPSGTAIRLVARIQASISNSTPTITARFDGRRILYAQFDFGSSDIMLMENLR